MARNEQIETAARDLLASLTFDDCGMMIAGKYQGGNGGLSINAGFFPTRVSGPARHQPCIALSAIPSSQGERHE